VWACIFSWLNISLVCFCLSPVTPVLDNKHPAMEMLRHNFRNFVGEDIELANRALGHSTRSQRGRAEVLPFLIISFSRCSLKHCKEITNYLVLCSMKNKHLVNEASHYRSLRGFTDNDKRLNYSKNPRVLADVRTGLLSCLLPCPRLKTFFWNSAKLMNDGSYLILKTNQSAYIHPESLLFYNR